MANPNLPPGALLKVNMPSRFEMKKAKQAAAEKTERDVFRLVDARDGHRCRACGHRCDPTATTLLERAHRHHIVYRSAGGETTTGNLATVCASCHHREHVKRTLRIEGNADEGLTLWQKDEQDQWYVIAQELAPHVVEKD